MKHYTILHSERNDLLAAICTITGHGRLTGVSFEINKESQTVTLHGLTFEDHIFLVKEFPLSENIASVFNAKGELIKGFCSSAVCLAVLCSLGGGLYHAVFICGDGSCYVFDPREISPRYTSWKSYIKKTNPCAVYSVRTGSLLTSNRLTYEEKEIRTATREAF